MKKLTKVVVLLGILSLVVFSMPSWSQNKKPKPQHAPKTLAGVDPEMLSPDYWIAIQDNPDEVVMTPVEIEEFNETVRNKKVEFKDRFGKSDPLINNYAGKLSIGLFMLPILPLDLPDTLPGDSLKVWLKSNIKYLNSRDFYDSRNALYTDDMKQELVDNINVDGVPDGIQRRFGIIVKRADVRLYPTSAAGFSETQWEMDFFQTTGVYIINPVAILHESVNGDFYYVQTPIARGWIAADTIALAEKEEIRTLIEDKNFLMATGDKIPVYGNPSFKDFHQYFYFSATLPIIRYNGNRYVVKLPYRRINGTLAVTQGYIRPDADVQVGYLPFTKHNVLTQIFKLLHKPYGWADQFNKRDCSGTQRVVLRCFGITTGRWPNFVLLASDHRTYIDPDLSTEGKIAEVSKIEPVITWCGTGGHLVLYLGKARNGKLYFMHQGGWGYNDGDQHYYVNRVAINEAHHKWYDINSPRVFTTFRK